MKQKNVNILRGEFIGKIIEVRDKKIKGKIVDETKNSFIIKSKNNLKKKLLKTNSVFNIKINKNFVSIDGNLILMKPEDRIKIKKWK